MAKASDEALFGRRNAAQLPQAERQRLESRHKLDLYRHKPDCTVDHNCSSLHPELWHDQGVWRPWPMSPCQALSASTPMGSLVSHFRRQALTVMI